MIWIALAGWFAFALLLSYMFWCICHYTEDE